MRPLVRLRRSLARCLGYQKPYVAVSRPLSPDQVSTDQGALNACQTPTCARYGQKGGTGC